MADETTPAEPDEFTDDLATESWSTDLSRPGLLARLGAEALGTFVLVLVGAGTAVLLSVTAGGPLQVGLAYGVAVLIGIVAFGAVSGAHFNPAITVGAWLAGRFPGMDVVPYVLAQVVGGIVAGGLLRMGIASLDVVDDAGVTSLMGNVSVGYGPNAPFASAGLTFGVGVALAVEAIAAGLLTLVVLAVVAKKISRSAAPFAIALTYGVLMMWAIPLTNGGLNPARATATALFSDTWALQQLWAWWLAPLLGAAVVGLLYRIYRPTEDTENAVESVED